MNGQRGGPPFGGRPGAPGNPAWGQQTPGQPQAGYGNAPPGPPQAGAYLQQSFQPRQQPMQGGYPQHPPQGYGQPQPPQGYGQPPQQAGGYAPAHASPQAPAGGAQAQSYGAPQNYGPQNYGPAPNAAPGYAGPGYGAPPAGYAPMQPGAPAPVRSWAAVEPKKGAVNFPPMLPAVAAMEIGLFGAVPCPACGATTHTGSVGGMVAAQAAGLVGRLVYGAIAAKYSCPMHGEIPPDAFPAHHRSAIDMRRFLKLGVAGALLLLVFALLIVRARFIGY